MKTKQNKNPKANSSTMEVVSTDTYIPNVLIYMKFKNRQKLNNTPFRNASINKNYFF